jgi:hypothetical protein
VKDFLRFQTSVMRGKIKQIPTDESLNCFAEWFFGGFARVTETVPTISYAIFVNLLGFGLAGLVRIIREGTASGTIDYSRFGNRRKVAEEVIVVKKRRLMLRLRALRVT